MDPFGAVLKRIVSGNLSRQQFVILSKTLTIPSSLSSSLSLRAAPVLSARQVNTDCKNASARSLSLPQNLIDLETREKVTFSHDRNRDLNSSVLLSQNSSVFSRSFMSDQLSIGSEGSNAQFDLPLATVAELESYDCAGSVSLHSVMQTAVPEPFCPQQSSTTAASVNDSVPCTHHNMPGSGWKQQDKFLANELQNLHHQTDKIDALTPQEYSGYRAPLVPKAWNGYGIVRCYSTSPPPDSSELTKVDKLKRAVKEYGSTVIAFHVTISVASLGLSYAAVSSGLDVNMMLSSLGVSSSFLESKVTTGAGTFVIAYALHKVFAPVRISITLAATPFIVRHLRKIGFLKPPKPSKTNESS